MSYPFKYPNLVNCNVDTFIGMAPKNDDNFKSMEFSWKKPQGVSFVWFTLIGSGGAGGSGNGTTSGGGGGSGGVTNCLIPAFLVPDNLIVYFFSGYTGVQGVTTIVYRTKNSDYTLLQANGGSNGGLNQGGQNGSDVTNAGSFGCLGLYQSVVGQAGTVTTSQGASPSTFLSGGVGSSASDLTITANYGYSAKSTGGTNEIGQGYFITSPIIVGVGGIGQKNNSLAGNGGIGCGGGGGISTASGDGGPGMATIISW